MNGCKNIIVDILDSEWSEEEMINTHVYSCDLTDDFLLVKTFSFNSKKVIWKLCLKQQ